MGLKFSKKKKNIEIINENLSGFPDVIANIIYEYLLDFEGNIHTYLIGDIFPSKLIDVFPDKKRIMNLSENKHGRSKFNNKIRIWDIDTGNILNSIEININNPTSSIILKNSNIVISSNEGLIYIIDPTTKLVKIFNVGQHIISMYELENYEIIVCLDSETMVLNTINLFVEIIETISKRYYHNQKKISFIGSNNEMYMIESNKKITKEFMMSFNPISICRMSENFNIINIIDNIGNRRFEIENMDKMVSDDIYLEQLFISSNIILISTTTTIGPLINKIYNVLKSKFILETETRRKYIFGVMLNSYIVVGVQGVLNDRVKIIVYDMITDKIYKIFDTDMEKLSDPLVIVNNYIICPLPDGRIVVYE